MLDNRPEEESAGEKPTLEEQTVQFLETAIRNGRRMAIFVVGWTVVLFGIALIVLPGPAFVFIPMGLGILAIEFEWARRTLNKMRVLLDASKARVRETLRKRAERKNGQS